MLLSGGLGCCSIEVDVGIVVLCYVKSVVIIVVVGILWLKCW